MEIKENIYNILYDWFLKHHGVETNAILFLERCKRNPCVVWSAPRGCSKDTCLVALAAAAELSGQEWELMSEKTEDFISAIKDAALVVFNEKLPELKYYRPYTEQEIKDVHRMLLVDSSTSSNFILRSHFYAVQNPVPPDMVNIVTIIQPTSS